MLDLAAALFGSTLFAWVIGAAGFALFLQAQVDRARMRRQAKQIAEAQEKLSDDLWEVKAAGEARVRAETSAHAKSRFLAAVSHEVRTPLNGVLGMAELLSGTPLEPEQQAYVDAIHTSGRALTALIDEVLDLTRIEAGKLDLAADAFSVRTVVEKVTELLAPRAQEKGLDIASLVAPDVPAMLLGDAARLRQVLINLTGNAIKFTERGGVGVRVVRAPGGGVSFTVTDTGPGVPPERRAAIFDEFEQGNAVIHRNHGGSGLGLSIARRIVTLMGGDLTLADRPGGGSVFGFTAVLPLAPDSEASAEPVLPDLKSRTALVVALAPFQGAFLAQMLGSSGARTSIAPTVEAALAQIAAATPDLLVVDCGLGQEACNRIADAATAAGIAQSLLMFSPFERRAFGQKMVSAFGGWLVKPIRAQSLANRLGPERPVALVPRGPAPKPVPRLAAGSTLRILLAEDNEINTMVMLKMLDRIGAQVTHAADGAVALTAALAAMQGEARAFDTILMDICMPGLDGQEAARLIRRAEKGAGAPPTRIVALTAFAFEDDRQACFDAGIDDFLTKPIDFGRLRIALGLEEPRAAWDESNRPLPLMDQVETKLAS